MIFSSICVQINTMFTKKEFKVAAVIALFYSCFAFAFTLTEFSGIDISKIKDANQLVCFSQSNRLWFFFSLLYPFLLVLPFSTSYIDDYKNQLLPVYISRTSRTICFNIDIIQSVEIALAKILSELVYLAILSIGITLYICRTDIF